MKRLVVDASVVVKWLLPQASGMANDSRRGGKKKEHVEEHTDHALALLYAFRDGQVEFIQPPHWLAEVGAVLARLEPERASTAIQLLDAMQIPVHVDPAIYDCGIHLATQLNHHLFDTLYHAVALTGPADMLVTADLQYWRKARRFGAICPLAEFIHT
jgi:predicted nucleic acid-binding protein